MYEKRGTVEVTIGLLRWLPARAHDNGFFLVFSNGIGEDDGEVRTGNAMIVDCYGRIVAETWEAKDRLVVAEADLDLLCSGRRWMRARRPELYGILVKRFGNELDPRQARFAEAPVEWIAAANRGEKSVRLKAAPRSARVPASRPSSGSTRAPAKTWPTSSPWRSSSAFPQRPRVFLTCPRVCARRWFGYPAVRVRCG